MGRDTYAALADLPVRIGDWSISIQQRRTSGGSDRTTSVISIAGDGAVGRGEDVTYEPGLHEQLAADPPDLSLDGEYTLRSASAQLEEVALFPAGPPERAGFQQYRRWGFESACLDLALQQAGTDLAGVLDRERTPVRFLVSTGLGNPPSADPIEEWLAIDPSLEFKIDLTQRPTPDVLDRIVETGAIAAIDLKAHYAGLQKDVSADGETPSWIGDPAPDPDFYEAVLEAFPDTVIEDPAVTEATRQLLEPASDRIAWDAPVHSVAEFDDVPLDVGRCNVKPSRFGTIQHLCEFVDYARDRGIDLYGGGQFELSVGRGHLHDLASLWYPDGPNDVAPRAYNAPEPRAGLPSSPLEVPEPSPGFGWPAPDESL
ncbi:MAG: hypothetical protein ABEH59_03180 [Halobacteriales archaeon]